MAEAQRKKREADNLTALRKYLLPVEAASMIPSCNGSISKERDFMESLYKAYGIMNPDGSWNEQGVERRMAELEEVRGYRDAVNLIDMSKQK